jgi:hypothetical protein
MDREPDGADVQPVPVIISETKILTVYLVLAGF